jgi:hypothetical protein
MRVATRSQQRSHGQAGVDSDRRTGKNGSWQIRPRTTGTFFRQGEFFPARRRQIPRAIGAEPRHARRA